MKPINLVEYYNNGFDILEESNLVLSKFDPSLLNHVDLEKLISLTTFQNEYLLIDSFRILIEPHSHIEKESLEEYIYTLYRIYFYHERYKLIPLDNFYLINPTYDSFIEYLRNETRKSKYSASYKGNIEWAAIREYINEIKFEKNHHIQTDNGVLALIKQITINSKSFNELEIDEKLLNIKSCNEYIIDKLGGAKNIDYKKLFLNIFDSEIILNFMNKLHAFRHFKKDTILERKNYSINDKLFLLETGIMLINHLYRSHKNQILI